MQTRIHIHIYGDSLMKGTVVDENNRYRSIIAGRIRNFEETFGVRVSNEARFGHTVEKGLRVLEKNLRDGADFQYALLEYGGNDCNFRWDEIGAAPSAEHLPFTPLPAFEEAYLSMISRLRAAGVTPVLITLPPIDGEKYLRFVSGGGRNGENILRWLRDSGSIYRFQELYSHAISAMARKTDTLLIHARERFLEKRNCSDFIGRDGIHLNEEGYGLFFSAIREFAAPLLSPAPA